MPETDPATEKGIFINLMIFKIFFSTFWSPFMETSILRVLVLTPSSQGLQIFHGYDHGSS